MHGAQTGTHAQPHRNGTERNGTDDRPWCQARRKEFAEGEEGRQEWKAKFNSYAGDFACSHVCTETVKGRTGAVGMWDDY